MHDLPQMWLQGRYAGQATESPSRMHSSRPATICGYSTVLLPPTCHRHLAPHYRPLALTRPLSNACDSSAKLLHPPL